MFFALNKKYVHKKIAVVVLILFLIGIFSGIYLKIFDFPGVVGGKTIDVDILSGASFNDIVDNLYSAGLIESKIVFKIYAFLSGKADKIKSGFYQINSSVSAAELLNILEEGPKEIAAMVFPGMTLKEIDDRFSGLKIIKKGDLIKYNNEFQGSNENDGLKKEFSYLKGEKSLEGYFLPDTYYFYQGSSVDFVVRKIIGNFNARVLPFLKDYANLKNSLIIASLLEKEIPNWEEQRIAAGILEKRLKAGMLLQIDATIVYIKCEGRFLNCEPLKKSDYKINSSFNTYIYAGLTPTPISNPSLLAIKAAINKKDSPYWYYLSDAQTGKTIFSKTFDEHNANRAVYFLNR